MEGTRRAPIGKLASDQDQVLADLYENRVQITKEIDEFEKAFGKKLNKINEPENANRTLWDFVLADVEKNVAPALNSQRDFKRFQRKKLAKISINAVQKQAKIIEEKAKAKTKQKKELSKTLCKKVYKDFWQGAFKVHKFSMQQQSKLKEKEDQRKRLDNLIKQQLKLSTQLAEVLAPTNGEALETKDPLLEMPAEVDPKASLQKAEPELPTLGKRRVAQQAIHGIQSSSFQKSRGKKPPPEAVIIELKKQKKKSYSFSKVIYSEKKYQEEASRYSKKKMPTIDPRSILPPILLNGKLRYYQFIGLKWLLSLHQKKLNGILADEMGLGKTIQTIALLSYLAGDLGIWGPHLVIVPTTLLVNWEMEFKRWAPGMKIFTYFGRLSERKEKRKGWSQLNSFQVCITSYKIATLESKVFRRRKWYYMILDEAQQIKNSNSQTWLSLSNFQTVRRLLLTGTPLQNNLIELWSLLAFLLPERFESHSDFKEWFSEPLQRALQSNQVVNKEIIDNLHNILRPILLRRLKKDVEKELPKKQEVIIKVPLSMRQRYLYDEFISQDIKKSNNNDFLNLMNLLMHLRKTCNHPDLIKPKDVQSGFYVDQIFLVFPRAFLVDPVKSHQLIDFWTDSWTHHERVRLAPKTSSWRELRTHQENKLILSFNSFNRDLKTAYMKMRSGAIQTRVKTYSEKQVNKAVCELHFLVRHCKIQLKEEMVQSLLYKLSQHTFDRMLEEVKAASEEFLIYYKKALSLGPKLLLTPYAVSEFDKLSEQFQTVKHNLKPFLAPLRSFSIRTFFQFPKQKNVMYDSGKLNRLIYILRDLRAKNHKCLIFTQVACLDSRWQKCWISWRWPFL